MPNQPELEGTPQGVTQTDDSAPVADGQPVLLVPDDEPFALTSDERAQVAALLQEDRPVETTIRGHRIIIVSDLHTPCRHLEIMALLAQAHVLVAGPYEDLVRGTEPGALLDERLLRLKAPEPIIVADFDDRDRRKGKGQGRKPWESPFGPPLNKHNGGQNRRNIRRMIPRKGGR